MTTPLKPFRPDINASVGDLKKRVRILEALNGFPPAGYFEWLPLTDVYIHAFGGPPTVSGFSGEYIVLPAPGIDPNGTQLAMIQFTVTVDDPTTPGGVPWRLHFSGDELAPTQSLGGSGTLIHTDPDDGSITNYNLVVEDSVPYAVAGVEPDPGSIPSATQPCWVRPTFPCVIATDDVLTGYIWGHTFTPSD